jgi:two-component system sensor histidine kinase HydH
MVTTTASKAMDGLDVGSPADNLPELLERCHMAGLIVVNQDFSLATVSADARAILDLGDTKRGFGDLPAPLQAFLRKGFSSKDTSVHLQIGSSSNPTGCRTLRVCVTPILDTNDRAQSIVAVIQDLTPARQLEQNLRQMDRLASIGTLSASMAHEVKNALVAIKTFVDLLISQNQDAKLAEIVNREMNRINSIVSQMLRFGGPARPKMGTIHIHQVVEQSLNLVQHHLEGRKIKLERSLEAAPDTVRGDTYQLEQAFINLLFNALDAMGADGSLHVATRVCPPDRVSGSTAPVLQITIKDDGIGIPPENLSRLFEPFFTTKANGTGLGLPITRRIIEEHRGTITVSSQPHQGTLFTITLPLLATRQP